MDVVAVDATQWSFDPFGGQISEDGKIFGRGSQDMKSVAIQYIEALRRLIFRNRETCPAVHCSPFMRTIHLLYSPDEELSGFIS